MELGPGGGPARAVLKLSAGGGPAVPMALPSAARAFRAAVRRCDPPSRLRSAPAAAPRGLSPAAASAGPRPGPPPPPRGAERSPPPPPVDFGDSREAFRSKSSAELLRGLVVLGLCAVEPLVQHNREVGGGRGPAWGDAPGRGLSLFGGLPAMNRRGSHSGAAHSGRCQSPSGGGSCSGEFYCETASPRMGSTPSGCGGAGWGFCRSRCDCSRWGDLSFRESGCFAGCRCVPGILSLRGVPVLGWGGLSP